MPGYYDKEVMLEAEGVQRRRTYLVLGVVFICLCIAGVVGMVVYTFTDTAPNNSPQTLTPCLPQSEPCIFSLVESIPENLTYPAGSPAHPSTFAGIQQIVKLAQHSIEIASYYWAMNPDDLPVQDPSDWQGKQLFDDLVSAGRDKGIKIRIVQNQPFPPAVVNDTQYLTQYAGAEVRTLDLKRMLGAGILHTKMWLVDRKHFYVGSANLDWRSFTQVKELGACVQRCSCLAEDMGKIFDAYWYLATPEAHLPPFWPPQYSTLYNSSSPMVVNFNGTDFNTFLSSSPPEVCPAGRSGDGDTIVEIINTADKFVHIAVMDYFPTTQFQHPRKYWPIIDDALRSAAFDRSVSVRLLASHWNHTWLDMLYYLQSLQDLQYKGDYFNIEIQVKLFVVPAYTEAQKNIPYARVNHNKYMVTDKTAYIGTSNWSGDYFTTTGGIGLVVHGNSGSHSNTTMVDIRQQLADIFERDWNSQYAFELSHFNKTMQTS